MQEELISKKELLEQYGISYGALYRWKRMGLIPEDWFLKKSVLTGQETFFPRELVCERIELILQKKDDLSLSELADQLNGKSKTDATLHLVSVYGEKTVHIEELRELKLTVGKETVDLTETIRNIVKEKTV